MSEMITRLTGDLSEIRASIADAEARKEALTQGFVRSGRHTMTPDQQARAAELDDKLTTLYAQAIECEQSIARVEEVAARRDLAAAKAPAVDLRRAGDPFQGDVLRATPTEARGQALTAIERFQAPDAVREACTRAVERASVNVTELHALSAWTVASGDPAYFRGLCRMLEQGQMAVLEDDEKRAISRANAVMRAMAIGSDAAGGFGVPVFIDPAIAISSNGYLDPMRSIATTTLITTDRWKGVSSTGVSASWDAEAAAVSDDTPVLVQPDIPVHAMRVFVPYSYEVGMDYPNLVEELGRLMADASAGLEATAFWTGSGNGQPTGLITALDANTNVEVIVTTDGAFAKEDIYKVSEALGDRFWARASWAANRQVWNKVRQMADTADGVKPGAFWADFSGDTPSKLLGKPVYEASAMPTFTGTTGAANIAVVGDFSVYRIVDRVSIMSVIPDLVDVTTNRPTGQRGMFMFRRVGGAPTMDNAFRLLQNQ